MMTFMCKECFGNDPCFHSGVIKPLRCPYLDITAKWVDVEETDKERVNRRLSEMIKGNDERPAATPEPAPTGNGSFVLFEVIKDICARADAGQKKYGTMLRTHNGRDSLNDALQEAIDLVFYLKQEIMEKDSHKEESGSLEDKIIKWANDRCLYEKSTNDTRLSKLHEEIGEWLVEVETGNEKAERLELGDMYVCLVNIAKGRGFSLEECGWEAYNKIKNRTGRMENGTFIKDSI